ncbi:transcription elongation factor S-II-like protein 1 [Sarcoptes scabiei]|uniref:Transcription elongation factor n=1 Tax=Sarcoptes scabiei TaxID=52283 RepID=A0A131ZTT9_SARSC|nr:transcription elongation factor S-II-like protein 1 [Sarcoptes scabiei]
MAKDEEELMRMAKKLEKITNRKDSSRTKITLDLIQKTRIGKIVNNLRKSIDDDEVSSLSKSLIKSWKKLLNEKDNPGNGAKLSTNSGMNVNDNTNMNGGGGGGDPSNKSTVFDESSRSLSGQKNLSTQSSCTNGKEGQNSLPSSKSSTTKFQQMRPKQSSFPSDTTDSVRLKCRELLANALKPDADQEEPVDVDQIDDLARRIENSVYNEFKDTNSKYKTRIRSRISNLNDKKNPDLKLNVLRGHIAPERIAVMTAEEMASNEMKQLRQKFTKEAINDAQMSLTGGTSTDLIKCPACKKNNCTYNQVQTRSADEPMTTFCFCNECGKRWKFC